MTTLVSIPQPDLEEILAAARSGNFVETVTLTYKAFDVDLEDPECPRIRPQDYLLPADQWEAICGALVGSDDPQRSSISRVNYGLEWVNIGPSAAQPWKHG